MNEFDRYESEAIEDREFERLLRESAPRIAEPSGLDAHGERLLAEVRRPARTAHRALLGAGLGALLVLGGGAVFASVGGFEPLGPGDEWRPDTSAVLDAQGAGLCTVGYRLEDNAEVPYDGDRRALLEAARSALKLIDLEALRTDDAGVRSLFAEASETAADPLPDIVLDGHAHLIATAEALHSALIAQGFAELPGLGEEQPYGLHAIGEPCE